VQPPVLRLVERLLHDLARDAVDLDVHLQRGDAVFRARHLEIHVAEMILVAEDVGKHLEAVAFLHEAHRDACDRRLDRHARIHEGKARAADRGHGARAVRFQDFRHHADDVREFRHVRHHGKDAAAGKIAVADFAALGSGHHAVSPTENGGSCSGA